MSQPNENVVNAMIESYLTARKLQWSLENQDGRVTLPDDDTETARKIDVCMKILQKTTNTTFITTNDWIDIILMLNELEEKESSNLSNLWFFRRLLGSALLLETLQAVRSYILESLQDNFLYTEHIKPLLKTRSDCETTHTNYTAHPDMHKPEQITKAKEAMDKAYKVFKPYDLEALTLNKHDHHTYFTKIISKDPESKKLKEENFKDFEKNVVNNLHKADFCKKLLSHKQTTKVETYAAKVTNKPIIQDATKTPPQPKAEFKVPEKKVSKPAASAPAPAPVQTPVKPVVVQATAKPTPPATSASTSSRSSKPAEHTAADPRRSSRKHHHEEQKTSVRDNSTFKPATKSSMSSSSTHRNDKSTSSRNNNNNDAYDWDEYFDSRSLNNLKSY